MSFAHAGRPLSGSCLVTYIKNFERAGYLLNTEHVSSHICKVRWNISILIYCLPGGIIDIHLNLIVYMHRESIIQFYCVVCAIARGVGVFFFGT